MSWWPCSVGHVLVTMFCWPCPVGQVLLARFCWPCYVGHVLVATSWRPCPGGHVLAARSQLPCPDSNALAATPWWPHHDGHIVCRAATILFFESLLILSHLLFTVFTSLWNMMNRCWPALLHYSRPVSRSDQDHNAMTTATVNDYWSTEVTFLTVPNYASFLSLLSKSLTAIPE